LGIGRKTFTLSSTSQSHELHAFGRITARARMKEVEEMARTSSRTLAVVGSLACLSLPLSAHAQIGSGWNSYSPTKRLQLRGCSDYSSANGIETFKVTCNNTTDDNRAEQRIEDDYSSGSRQFEGYVRVASLSGTNISLKQTFQANNGAFLMIAVASDSGGRLYPVGTSTTLATNVSGTWVRINTIHDVSSQMHRVYINGSQKFTKSGGTSPWYNKYGAYRTGSGKGPATIEWRDTRFWRDGSASGGTTTPTPTATPRATPTATATPASTPTATPTPTGTGFSFEAESVAYTHSGTGATLQADANASNGQWVSLDAENTGSWLEFTTPSIPAGTYSLRMSYKTNNNRGQLVMRVDGTQVGGTLDQYGSPSTYPTVTFGNVSFAVTGTHKLRLVVTGKNASSSSYVLSADRFTLQ
jgi:hypothetical protein